MKLDDVIILYPDKLISVFREKEYIVRDISDVYNFINLNIGSKRKILLIRNNMTIPNMTNFNFNFSIGSISDNYLNVVKFSLDGIVFNFSRITNKICPDTRVQKISNLTKKNTSNIKLSEYKKLIKSNEEFKLLIKCLNDESVPELVVSNKFITLKNSFNEKKKKLISSNKAINNSLNNQLISLDAQYRRIVIKSAIPRDFEQRKKLLEKNIKRNEDTFKNEMKLLLDEFSRNLDDYDSYILENRIELERMRKEEIARKEELKRQAELKKHQEADRLAKLREKAEREKQAEIKKLEEKKAAMIKRQEEIKRIAEAKRQAELKKQQEEEARRQAEMKKQEEARRLAEMKKKQEEEAKRQAELKKKQEEEARRQAELKKQQEEAKRQAKLKKQQEEEAKRNAELKKQQEEAKRNAELKKQQEEEEARRQTELKNTNNQLKYKFELQRQLAIKKQLELNRIAEKSKAERLAAEKAEAEKIAAEKAEAEKIAAEKAKAEKIAVKRAKAERLAVKRAKAERLAAEKAEAERLEAQFKIKNNIMEQINNVCYVIVDDDNMIKQFRENNSNVKLDFKFIKKVDSKQCMSIYKNQRNISFDKFHSVDDVVYLKTTIIAMMSLIKSNSSYGMIVDGNITLKSDFISKFSMIKLPFFNVLRLDDSSYSISKVDKNTNTLSAVIYNVNYVKRKLLNFCNRFVGNLDATLNNVPKSYIVGSLLVDNYKIYNGSNNVTEYIRTNHKNGKYFRYVPNKENSITIDKDLYQYLNKDKIIDDNILKDIYNNGVINGYIYSINQIKNHYGYDKFYTKNKKIYIKENDKFIDLKDIVNNLYNKDFNYFIDDIKCLIENITNQTDTIMCNFIGDYEIGKILIEKIINSDKKELANLFIFRKLEDYEKLKDLLNIFENKIVFKSKEYGNDIIPTLQALNYYNSKYEYSNLIKLQTKSKIDWFNECSDYLINNTVEYLMSQYDESNCNCVGHPNHYINTKKDNYCRDLYNKYSVSIDKENFVEGTMFYTNKDIIDNIIEFINNNYRGYFINNMYDNNAINLSNSPVHFLERLFGILKSNEFYENILKPICIYFPQFHEIKENNHWCKGWDDFTWLKNLDENDNLHILKPHRDIGYYNILDYSIRRKQGKIAKQHGIYGFCYYHYWFYGYSEKCLMYKFYEKLLKDGEPNIPFFINWANEPWTKKWNNGTNDTICDQNYDLIKKDVFNHFNYLLPLFKHKNYIKIKNKPLFVIYQIYHIHDYVEEFTNLFNNLAKENGFDGIYFLQSIGLNHYPSGHNKINEFIDGAYETIPNNSLLSLFEKNKYNEHINNNIKYMRNKVNLDYMKEFDKDKFINYNPDIYKYKNDDKWLENYLKYVKKNEPSRLSKYNLFNDKEIYEESYTYPRFIKNQFLCITPGFNNLPRTNNKCKSLAIISKENNRIKLFEETFKKQVKITMDRKLDEKFIFINAWNEWGEGMCIEPSNLYGYAFLNIIKKTLLDNNLLIPKKKLKKLKCAVMTTYKNRPDDLEKYYNEIKKTFQLKTDTNFDFYLLNQDNNKKFNKVKLWNAGINELIDKYDFYIFNDLDLIPSFENDVNYLYNYPYKPIHMSSYVEQFNYLFNGCSCYKKKNCNCSFFYESHLYGGVFKINNKDLKNINGFNNDYVGWGYEDCDISTRIKKYNNVKHIHGIYHSDVGDNSHRYFKSEKFISNKLLYYFNSINKNSHKINGYKQLNYKLNSITEKFNIKMLNIDFEYTDKYYVIIEGKVSKDYINYIHKKFNDSNHVPSRILINPNNEILLKLDNTFGVIFIKNGAKILGDVSFITKNCNNNFIINYRAVINNNFNFDYESNNYEHIFYTMKNKFEPFPSDNSKQSILDLYEKININNLKLNFECKISNNGIFTSNLGYYLNKSNNDLSVFNFDIRYLSEGVDINLENIKYDLTLYFPPIVVNENLNNNFDIVGFLKYNYHDLENLKNHEIREHIEHFKRERKLMSISSKYKLGYCLKNIW